MVTFFTVVALIFLIALIIKYPVVGGLGMILAYLVANTPGAAVVDVIFSSSFVLWSTLFGYCLAMMFTPIGWVMFGAAVLFRKR